MTNITIGMRTIITILGLASACLASLSASGQDSLNRTVIPIQDATNAICGIVSNEGSQTVVEVNGKVEGVVNKLIKSLVDIDISLSGTLTNSHYQGVIREQLGNVITHNTDCRKDVFDKLIALVYNATVVSDDGRCPTDTQIRVNGGSFVRNGTAFLITRETKLCIIDSNMQDNKTVIEVKP